MNDRVRQLSNILDYQANHEQLWHRRVAICRRAVAAAEARLTQLRQQEQNLRRSGCAASLTVQWYQYRQQGLGAVRRRIGRIEQLRQRLEQRIVSRRAELVKAAQRRRATETTLGRTQRQAERTAQRATEKQSDELVRTERIHRAGSSNVAAT